jgi:branched-chain amino acid transport system substrate-binding protein
MLELRNTRRLVVVAIAAASVVAGCGSSDDSSSGSGSSSSATSGSKAPVKVLAILDMTGPTKYLGTADKAGIDAGVNYLNKNGGIDGHKVQLDVVSDNGDPTTSVTTLLKYIASKGKPTYVFTGSFSSIAAALQPVATREKLLAWSFGDGNFACAHDAATKCGPFFSFNSVPNVYVQQQVEYIKQKGYKKIGIIADQRDTSVTESAIQKKLYPTAGIEPTFITTPAKTLNVLPQMSKLKSAGVDMVFAEQIGPATGYVLQARKKLGWKVPVVFDISGSSSSIDRLAPKELWSDDASMQIFADVDPSTSAQYPGKQVMLDSNPAAKQKGGFGGLAFNTSAFGWNAMMLLDGTISGSHSLDPTVNQKWLETHEVPLDKTRALMKTHKFSADSHENMGWVPEDYAIVPIGPLGEDGMLQNSGS